jgi:hypothetical protein
MAAYRHPKETDLVGEWTKALAGQTCAAAAAAAAVLLHKEK